MNKFQKVYAVITAASMTVVYVGLVQFYIIQSKSAAKAHLTELVGELSTTTPVVINKSNLNSDTKTRKAYNSMRAEGYLFELK